MVGSGPGGLLYPYVVRGYRKSTSPAQEELLGHRRLEIENPPGWLPEWSGQIGAALKDGLREPPGWIAFAQFLQLPLRQLAEGVGNGAAGVEGDRSVADGFPAETVADRVDGAVGE
jgi:hypothetical protein